ncbi:MAG TPA: RNA polymerase sigma factor [Vicinamibacterales bacterium]|nr:RNA polymerase sigma factor [Vicinamibacterales bacterium]
MHRFLRHYLGDLRAADDVTQDVFLALWKGADGFDPTRGTLRQYVFGVARRRGADWRRRHIERIPARAPDPLVDAVDRLVEIRDALTRLDADDRALLWLRDVEGHSYAELAALFEIPLGTIKSRLFTARTTLRRLWLSEPPVVRSR